MRRHTPSGAAAPQKCNAGITSRPRHAPPCSSAAPGAGAAAAEHAHAAGVERLSLEELRATLHHRSLSTEGGRPELEQRLESFLERPERWPQAAGRAAPVVVLGGRLFASHSHLRSHIQLLLRLLERQEVAPGDADFAFLSAVLQRHPRFAAKVTPPLRRFRVVAVVRPDGATHDMFEFMDSRGVWEDFSYRKCIGVPPDHNADITFRDAMRHQAAARRVCGGVGGAGAAQRRCVAVRLLRAPRGPRGRPAGGVHASLVPADEAWLPEWREYHRRNVRGLQLHCKPCRLQRRRERDVQQLAR